MRLRRDWSKVSHVAQIIALTEEVFLPRVACKIKVNNRKVLNAWTRWSEEAQHVGAILTIDKNQKSLGKLSKELVKEENWRKDCGENSEEYFTTK